MEENQEVKLIESLSLFAIFILTGALIGGVFWELDGDNKPSQALRGAERLVGQLKAGGIVSGGSERLPAETEQELGAGLLGSEGSIGEDPWGTPYRFKYFREEYGQWLVVWSAGPNKKLETQARDVTLTAGRKPLFLGDDLGISSPIKPQN